MQWFDKDIHSEIEIQLARELNAHGVKPMDVEKVRAVVGGDHGDTSFQFVAEITAELRDYEIGQYSVMRVDQLEMGASINGGSQFTLPLA